MNCFGLSLIFASPLYSFTLFPASLSICILHIVYPHFRLLLTQAFLFKFFIPGHPITSSNFTIYFSIPNLSPKFFTLFLGHLLVSPLTFPPPSLTLMTLALHTVHPTCHLCEGPDSNSNSKWVGIGSPIQTPLIARYTLKMNI